MAENLWLESLKILLTALAAGAAGFGGWIALKNWKLGEENRKLSLENTSIALKNSELAAQNTRIANENAENAVRWKRAELAASYMQPLFQEEELLFALRCIDWATGTLPVPLRHRPMLKGNDTIDHNPDLLVKAMQPKLTSEVANTPQGMLYRLALDALFTRVEWIGNRVVSGLISVEDVPDLKYWMRMLSKWPYAPDGTRVFVPFLEATEYETTLELMRRFGVLAR
jgi:hypothetical protein